MKISMASNQKHMEQIYDTYVDAIFRFVFIRIRDRDKALDITQETFTRLWKSYLVEGKHVENPRALLYQIARNLLINTYEREIVHTSLDALADEGMEYADERADSEARAHIMELYAHLDTLREEEREVIVLRHLEGFAVKEIAEMFEVSENVISVRLHRALNALQKLYTQL